MARKEARDRAIREALSNRREMNACSRTTEETGRRITKAQEAALRVYLREGELNEGWLAEEWPAIRNARLVAKGMERRGLVTFGEYTGRFDDGGAGYELILTDAGRAAVDAIEEPDRA